MPNPIGRLTWNSISPAPFESGWSVFTKVLFLNHMDIRELVSRIKKDEVKSGITPLNLWDSSWINFKYYGSLLEVNPERLKTGFLDQLGFNPGRGGAPYQIRHCHECVAMGYHCTLFGLTLFECCPWHRKKLMEPCGSCLRLFSRKKRNLNSEYCEECRISMLPFFSIPDTNKVAEPLSTIVTGYCAELIEWWEKTKKASENFPGLTRSILSIGDPKFSPRIAADTLLGFIDSVVQEPSWTYSIRPWPSRLVELNALKCTADGEQQELFSSQQIEKGYRSIRRHIYRKYVFPHKKALQEMMYLDRDEVFCLNADKVNIVALSYLVWRMSIEGICVLDGLKMPRKGEHRLRMMVPETLSNQMPISIQLNWIYYEFLGLWKKLDTYLTQYKKISIDLGSYYFNHSNLHHHYDEAKISPNIESGCETIIRVAIIYPELPPRKKVVILLPNDVEDEKSIIDCGALVSRQLWGWSETPTTNKGVIFRFTHTQYDSGRHFIHIIV